MANDVSPAPTGPAPVALRTGILVWLGIALLFAFSIGGFQILEGTATSALETFWSGGGYWLVFGAFAPVGLGVFRRLAGRVAGRIRTVAAFVAAWLLMHGLTQVAFVAIEQWIVSPAFHHPREPFREAILGYGARRGAISLLGFLGVVGFDAMRQTLHREADVRRQAVQLRADVAAARLEALRLQLQPHFLFNTLNAIAAEIGPRPHLAERMIEQLSDLLRTALRHGTSQTIPLAREFELIQTYLEIQATRFSDRLRFVVSHPPELSDAPVPPLVLQPLVENAIRHGVGPKPGGGTVRVTAFETAAGVHLRVDDDGVGVGEGGFIPGLGLTNTIARLEALSPPGALELGARPDGGTTALLLFPGAGGSFVAARAPA